MNPNEYLRETRQAWRRARDAWPGVQVSLEELRLCVEQGGRALSFASDLFLSRGLAKGDAAALAHFDRAILPSLRSRLARFATRTRSVEDICQDVRVALLLGPKPKIARYQGMGSLEGWLNVVATRLAIDHLRHDTAIQACEQPGYDAVSFANPEVQAMKERYAPQLNVAIANAFAEISDAERALLKMYFQDGLSIDSLAVVLCVHRSTAARHVIRLEARMHSLIAQHLQGVLPEATDLASVVRLVLSRISFEL